MNIIQIQDRLKGLPTDALVNYVEQPMGEVPIYLALGELQRRKEMRERYQADQTPPPSVAEQLVAENKPQPMQMGLGAMAPQGMMPTPAPAPEMDPRQLAASGIAANPVSNVGSPAMMAKGGIVGEVTNKMGKSNPVYEDGSIGAAFGLAVPSILARIGAGMVPQKAGLPTLVTGTSLVPRAGTSLVPTTGGALVPVTGGATQTATPGFFARALDFARQRPFVTAGGVGAATTVPFLFGGDPEEGNEEETEKPKGEPKKESTQKGMTLEDYVEEYNKAMGENESITRAKERLADRRDSAANMALIEAGLNIAAGESPDALTNIAKGATTGVKGYTESLKEMDALDLAIGQAERAERLAAVNFGMQSIEARRAAQQKLGLIQYKAQLEAQIKGMVTPDVRRKIREDLIAEGVRDNIIAQLTDSMGENAVGTKEFNDAVNQQFELAIQEVGLGPVMTGSGEDYSGFTIK